MDDVLMHYGTPRHSGRYLGDRARIHISTKLIFYRVFESWKKRE